MVTLESETIKSKTKTKLSCNRRFKNIRSTTNNNNHKPTSTIIKKIPALILKFQSYDI